MTTNDKLADALRNLIRAGKHLRNTVVETRGVAGMDDHDVAISDALAALAEHDAQPAPVLEKWEIDSMQTLADALEKRGDDLSTDSASWLRKYLMLAAAPQPAPVQPPATGDVQSKLQTALLYLNRAIEIAECNDPTNADHSKWARDYVLNALCSLAQPPAPAPDECFCDRMYPDSNPNASCGDCPTRDYAPQPAPAPVHEGLWRCSQCGEPADAMSSRWRWSGKEWQHHHGAQVGHVNSRYFGSDAAPVQVDECEECGNAGYTCDTCKNGFTSPPAPAADGAGELPPLPPVDGYDKRVAGHYSAASMHAYARAAIAAADAEDAYVIDRLSQLLARIAIAVKGPEKPLSCHGYHDLPELIEKLVESQNQFAAAGELPPLPVVPPGLIDALLAYRQIDEDGTDCGVSRQAVHEAADILRSLAAIAALRQPVPDAVREDVLIRQLRGRAAFLRNRGRVKSPALMEEAASRLESALASQQESRND